MKEVEPVAEKLEDIELLLNTIDLIGLAIHSKEGTLDSSFETILGLFERGLKLRLEINNQWGFAESFFHIGLTYQNRAQASDEDVQRLYEAFQKSYTLSAKRDF